MAENAERADGTGDEHLVLRGVARLAGELHAAVIEFDDAVGQTEDFRAYGGWR